VPTRFKHARTESGMDAARKLWHVKLSD